jgi:pimeloyl-ACP methyl ester carboxylesterase
MSVTTEVGSGPNRVLVLHGWTLDSSVWRWALADRDAERFTYALVDFPGYGRARSAPPAVGIDGMAEAAFAAADALGWMTFSVLGHSMGGTTALRMASIAPERVERVCAVTPVAATGFPVDTDSYERFEAAWPEAGWILGFVSPELSPDLLQELERLSASTLTRETWAVYLANWTGASFLEAIVGLSTPITFLLGDRDPIATQDHLSGTIAALGGSRVVTLPGAAHFPMVEQPHASVKAWETALAPSRALV